MAVPYTFGSATTSIPLSQLDSNFATAVTLGNTAVQLGNTITNLTGVSNVASATSLSLGSNGNTTAVTIDTSQNVGIGTSSPRAGYNLTLGAGGTGATNGTLNLDGSNASSQGAGIRFARNSVATGYIGSAGWLVGGTSSDLVFSANTSATEAMRIDSSGNLGLGVTPSAWGSSYKTVAVNTQSNFYASGNQGGVTLNAYNDNTNWRYTTADYATRYLQYQGAHYWNIASSGTAGGIISFIQAMTLDASGNVGIGTTSPFSTAANRISLSVNGTTDSIIAVGAAGTRSGYIYGSTTQCNLGAQNFLVFETNNGSERARIDSSGNTYIEAGLLWQYAPTPTTKAAAATLTAAELATDIITLTGTTYTVTLPTGTAIDTYYTGVPTTNIGYDFHIINTASGTITMAVGASGMTSVGTLTITTGLSAHFRLRRTAANTYVLYRLS